MKNKISVAITLGFALFAMFFGAGNLILPPYIGMKTGNEWAIAVAGFFTTGIVAPFLGVLTIALYGNSITDLNRRIPNSIITLLAFFIMVCLGVIAIPRTASTTYEIGVKPIVPAFNNILFSIIFFIVVYILSVSKSKIVDIIGNYLTPFLMLSLSVLVIAGTFKLGYNAIDTGISTHDAYIYSLQEGYQTLDVLASVIFAGIIIQSAISKGYDTKNKRFKITILSGIISMMALLLIYGGLIYLGANAGYNANAEISRTELLLSISNNVLGEYGTYIISIAIDFACLTTAIALCASLGSFFEDLSKGKMPYKIGVLVTCIVSAYLSIKSVDEIISYAAIILNFIYPITFALILTILFFGKKVRSKKPYVAAIIASAVVASLSVFLHLDFFSTPIESVKGYLPLSEQNMEWILPTFITFGLVTIFSKKPKTEVEQE